MWVARYKRPVTLTFESLTSRPQSKSTGFWRLPIVKFHQNTSKTYELWSGNHFRWTDKICTSQHFMGLDNIYEKSNNIFFVKPKFSPFAMCQTSNKWLVSGSCSRTHFPICRCLSVMSVDSSSFSLFRKATVRFSPSSSHRLLFSTSLLWKIQFGVLFLYNRSVTLTSHLM